MTPSPAQLVLVRHGETAWTLSGQHTGTTDLPLTAAGEDQARAVGRRLEDQAEKGQTFATVLTSPRARARRTASLAGFPDALVVPDLVEWDYGPVEGRTSDEVSDELGHDWDIFREGVQVVSTDNAVVENPTPGETLDEVAARARRVIASVQATLAGGESVIVFAHGHLLRVLCAVWLGLPPTSGELFELDTAATCLLGSTHDRRSVQAWNLPPA
ncbi:histidine phosphatase family protein [Luteimicrobium subarcticum]|uniref:histidine phosphatase family protein n=1 Tax=Luteimicrobium subarcticum TaxID=620910 RepID=UPI001FEC2DAF|nr:histidine phosphatase family protein [Luteimicrobium subarcticum]